MGDIAWPQLEVGESLRTPFGDAVIKRVDTIGLLVETDLGTWDFAEVEPRGSLESGEKVTEFLLGPRFVVLTASDYEVVACNCGCRDCSLSRQRHKLTRRLVIHAHEQRVGCACHAQGCWCIASLGPI